MPDLGRLVFRVTLTRLIKLVEENGKLVLSYKNSVSTNCVYRDNEILCYKITNDSFSMYWSAST